MELPIDFPHKAPKGYSYEVTQFKRNVTAIWLRHHAFYSYTTDPVRTIWGFVKTTSRSNSHTYHAPINANKVGEPVNIADTRSYTAMPLKLNPLELAFYS